MTPLLGLGTGWMCVALVRAFVGIARSDREPKPNRPISGARDVARVVAPADEHHFVTVNVTPRWEQLEN